MLITLWLMTENKLFSFKHQPDLHTDRPVQINVDLFPTSARRSC